MKFLLDANAVSGLFRGHRQLARTMRLHSADEFALSAVVFHELLFGAYRSARVNRNLELISRLPFAVLAFDDNDARQAAEIRAVLADRGRPIGPYDVLIAGQARARDLTVITRNIAEFVRVPGLRVENWEGDPGPRKP